MLCAVSARTHNRDNVRHFASLNPELRVVAVGARHSVDATKAAATALLAVKSHFRSFDAEHEGTNTDNRHFSKHFGGGGGGSGGVDDGSLYPWRQATFLWDPMPMKRQRLAVHTIPSAAAATSTAFAGAAAMVEGMSVQIEARAAAASLRTPRGPLMPLAASVEADGVWLLLEVLLRADPLPEGPGDRPFK